jgi:WD40 repeat protein
MILCIPCIHHLHAISCILFFFQVHFQLRHLLAATSAHDIFYCSENRVMHCNLLGKAASQEVLDASGAVPIPGIGSFPVCTLCAKEGLVAAGGFNGELVVRRIGSMRKFDAALRVTNSENGITNAIDAYRPRSGAQLQLVLSNNDCAVRLYDAGSFLSVATFRLPWAVNCSAADPHGRLLCVVGDDPENVILDACSGAVVARLRGHVDYSFACAWHPDGNVIATGNQDLTTRVYDLRYAKKPMALLKSRIGAVRSLRFSPDGRFLAAAEPADYVRLYDAAMTYTTAEEIDLFGELAGICFDPVVGNRLFIAVSDMHYASLLQYNRRDSLDLVE